MKLNNVLHKIVIVGIYLAPFVPLVITSSMFFPYITGKNFAFRIIVEVITAAWLILALRDPLWKPRVSTILKTLAIFVALIAISDLLSPNSFKSFWSNFERMEGWITLAHLFAYFVVVGTVLNSEKLWRRFFQMSIAVSMIVAGYGILQLSGNIPINQGGVRLDSTFGNASYLAGYMMFHFFLTAFLLFRERVSRFKQVIYVLAGIVELFILYHTATRGAMVGLAAGFLVTFLLVAIFERERPIIRKVSIGALVALVVAIGAFVALRHSNFVSKSFAFSRLASISLSDATPRAKIWSMALLGLRERPLFGWGQESFNYVFNKYYDPSLYNGEQWFDRAHNFIFDWLAAGGVLGFAAYIGLFVVALYSIWSNRTRVLPEAILKKGNRGRKKNVVTEVSDRLIYLGATDKAILTGLFAGYVVQNLFVFDNIVSYIVLFSLLAFVHTNSSRLLSDDWYRRLTVDEGVRSRLITPLVIVALGFAIYFLNVRGIMTATYLIDALGGRYQGGPAENLKYFDRALAYDSFGKSEVREQLVNAAGQILHSNADIAVKQAYFDKAISAMQSQIRETPDDTRYFVFMGSFLDTAGAYDDGLKYLRRASELSPKKQMILFEIGFNYLNRGKYTDALEPFKTAYELDHSFHEAAALYGLAAIYSKDFKLAEKILTPVFGTILVPEDRFIMAYQTLGQYDKVLYLRKLIADHNPNNAQDLLSLGAAYLQVGERQKAIAAVENAIKLDQSLKDQGEYYIREIKAGRNP